MYGMARGTNMYALPQKISKMEEGKLASISLQKFTELEELAEEIMGDKHQVSWHLDKLQNTPQLICISWKKE